MPDSAHLPAEGLPSDFTAAFTSAQEVRVTTGAGAVYQGKLAAIRPDTLFLVVSTAGRYERPDVLELNRAQLVSVIAI